MLYDPWKCEADTEKGLQKAGNEGLFTDFYLEPNLKCYTDE